MGDNRKAMAAIPSGPHGSSLSMFNPANINMINRERNIRNNPKMGNKLPPNETIKPKINPIIPPFCHNFNLLQNFFIFFISLLFLFHYSKFLQTHQTKIQYLQAQESLQDGIGS